MKRLSHPLTAPLIAVLITALYYTAQGEFRLLTPDQQAYLAFEADDYDAAAERFADPRWRAAALYRQGRFEEAAALLAGFEQPEDLFNRGNALAMLGRYPEAASLYEQALEQRPGWEAARRNRDIVLSRATALEQGRGETPGTMLGADEIVTTSEKSPPGAGVDESEPAAGGMSDAELHAIWLRQVQNRSADFLRAKFAHQRAMQQQRGNP